MHIDNNDGGQPLQVDGGNTVHGEIFTLLNFCEFCKLRLSRKNFYRKNLCRQLVGAVIVGHGILLLLRTSLYGVSVYGVFQMALLTYQF